MKFTIHRLRVGDLVWAQVVEVIADGNLITSFQGDLIRVANHSQRHFASGDKILVRVTQSDPLTFQIVNENEARKGATRLNVSI